MMQFWVIGGMADLGVTFNLVSLHVIIGEYFQRYTVSFLRIQYTSLKHNLQYCSLRYLNKNNIVYIMKKQGTRKFGSSTFASQVNKITNTFITPIPGTDILSYPVFTVGRLTRISLHQPSLIRVHRK